MTKWIKGLVRIPLLVLVFPGMVFIAISLAVSWAFGRDDDACVLIEYAKYWKP